MWDNIVGRQIRRSTRNLLLWNVLILVGIIVFFALSSRYWYNFALGPFPLSADEVTKLKDDEGLQFFVSIRGEKCVDVGEREVTVTKKHGVEQSRKDSAKYLIMLIDNQLMYVKTDMDASNTDVERRGILRSFKDEMNKPDVGPGPGIRPPVPPVVGNPNPAPAPQLKFLPVILDTTTTRTKGVIALIVFGIIGLINVVNILKAFSRFGNPQKHPTAKALMKYGDPEEVAQKIDEEYNSEDRQVIGPVTITRSWLIHPTTFGVQAMFLGDSAWAYKTITQHYTNGVPTGKTFGANLCDIHGTQYTVALKSEELTDQFVIGVLQRVPWVLVGYDAELDRLWKKDKPRIYELVEQRRQELAEEIRRQREAPEVELAEPDDDEPMDVEPA